MEIWAEMISVLGFPIACVIALGIFILKIYKRSEDREDILMAEIREMREINANAIDTIAHYTERLDTIQKDIGEVKADIAIIKSKE